METKTLNQKKNGKVDSSAPSPAFARVPGGSGRAAWVPIAPAQLPSVAPGAFWLPFPPGAARLLSEKPAPEPGLEKQQQETLAGLAVQWEKALRFGSGL